MTPTRKAPPEKTKRSRRSFTKYRVYSAIWDSASSGLSQTRLERSVANVRAVTAAAFDAVIGAPQVPLAKPLVIEFARIYSRTLRRLYELSHATESRLPDAVLDELRALFELMVQCFYLHSVPHPERTAETAFLLSIRALHGDEIFAYDPQRDSHLSREEIKNLQRVAKRVATIATGAERMYAGLNLSKLAMEAGLVE